MNVVDASTDTASPVVITDTLTGFHARFGHLALDTIERMVKDPASGIKISHHERKPCMVCTEEKKTRAQQPTKDTREHAPFDKIGGVICSDLKGPMTPLDGQAIATWSALSTTNRTTARCSWQKRKTWLRRSSRTSSYNSRKGSTVVYMYFALTAKGSTETWTSFAKRTKWLVRCLRSESTAKRSGCTA